MHTVLQRVFGGGIAGFNAIIAFQEGITQTVEIEVCLGIPSNPVIELSEETPSRQRNKHDTLFDNTHATTMHQKSREHRSESQRRHDMLLHKSHSYHVASLEDMFNLKIVEHQRKGARVAEADAEYSKIISRCT